jgi:dynein heavy chain
MVSSSIVPEFHFNKNLPYFQVETVDTVRFGYCFELLLYMRKPFYATGVTGTGKTALIQNLLLRLEPPIEEGGHGVLQIPIGFSAQTDSFVTQMTIEGKLEKKRKTLLGAPANKKVVIFVDDINMPFVQTYGAQAPIELLRQLVDQGGFYDRDKLFWKDIQDSTLIIASAPPGGGRNDVTPRFARHFNVLCMQAANDVVLDKIFSSILGGFLDECKFQDSVKVRGITRLCPAYSCAHLLLLLVCACPLQHEQGIEPRHCQEHDRNLQSDLCRTTTNPGQVALHLQFA